MTSERARDMTATELVAEHTRLCLAWDELRSDPELAGGGSPGEWMIERIGEIETEQRRRSADA